MNTNTTRAMMNHHNGIPVPNGGGCVNNSSHYRSRSNTNRAAILRGAMIFHRIGEFAILVVIAIAITTIPFSYLSSGTLPRMLTVHAFAPTTTTARRTFGTASHDSFSPRRIITNPLHTKSSPLMPLRAADTTPTTSGTSSTFNSEIPRIDPSDLQTLREQGYVIVENFLPDASWMEGLREDVLELRRENKFKIAKIGQDSTNALNEEIRVAETCFLARDKPELRDVPNTVREKLFDVLDALRVDLSEGDNTSNLDASLSEFLYAYYPKGGFYRRHRDAIKGSASWLREYSLLLYLNEESYDAEKDGGCLRVHFDSGGDFLPAGEAPLFQDVDACGGTLVLFESNRFPHEVLDTVAERFAVVGWYNRPMTLADLSAISDSGSGGAGEAGSLAGDPIQLAALAVAAGLVTVGLINLFAS